MEDTVVGAGVGVRIPEVGCTEAERRRLHPLLRQSLLQLSPQSCHEPVNTQADCQLHCAAISVQVQVTQLVFKTQN